MTSDSGVTRLIIEIQRDELGAELGSTVLEELRWLASEYSIDDTWLAPIFEAVHERRAVTPPIFFEHTGSDPYTYLYEVTKLLGWQARFEGEFEALEFPRRGVRLYISNESHDPVTGRGGSSYEVTLTK